MPDQKPCLPAGRAKKSISREYHLFAFRIIGDFGASIAVPVVLFVLLGQYLDGKYGRTPLFTILGFAIAALISGRIIYKKAKLFGREYKELNERADKDKKEDCESDK